jgi:transcriptional regulator with XRE-family HTH domain
MDRSMADSYPQFKPEYGSSLPIVCHVRPFAYALWMTFGQRLAERRKELGMTQAELGKGLGTEGVDVGKQVVYGWEKDQHYPRVDQLILICRKLQCSADFLLFGSRVESNPKMAAAQKAINALSDEQRLELFTAIMQPGLGDQDVEAKIPATRTKPVTSADEVLRRARIPSPATKTITKKSA